MAKNNIVVIGAGVAGLTTALLLARKGHEVTVVAKHMPGDYHIEYCSPWAGANFFPVSALGTREEKWDRATLGELYHLAENVPEAGIHFQDVVLYTREKDSMGVAADWFRELCMEKPWFAELVREFEVIPTGELPEGVDVGTQWKSVCINPAIYLPYLVSQCLKHRVLFRRAALRHISHAPALHRSGQADVVVNCPGLQARDLGGVEDKAVYPARGQTVLVRNVAPKMYGVTGTDDGEDEAMYIMTRAAGGGTILGGTYQKNNWDSDPDMNTAQRIMKRAVEWCPELVGPGQGVEGLDIIRHGVGLRPLREGGPRLERESIGDLVVVHNYGAGGFGYQASYGMAAEAVGLVEEFLKIRGEGKG